MTGSIVAVDTRLGTEWAVASPVVRAVVLLPTFNEAENIELMLRALRERAPDVEVIVLDDASPDGTGAIAERVASDVGRVEVLHRAGKAGLGAAYRDGFAVALGRGVDVVVTMDCDFSHDPAVVPTLVSIIEQGADVVIGSRYVRGGGTVDWPVRRQLLSKWGNRYTGLMLRTGVRDCTSGFRAYRATALAAIEPTTTTAEGYAFLTELVRRLTRVGATVVETPIIFRDRERGTSKMSGRIILESMLLVTSCGFSDRWASLRRRT
jgi:dolichol-phosphate mannosyltransferase